MKNKYSSLRQQYHKLIKERDDLKEDVIKLAKYNYAREPDFVRDRLKLRETIDEVAHLRRHVERRSNSLLNLFLYKFKREEKRLSEESELMAKNYFSGELKLSHEEFIDRYTKLRKDGHKAILLVDKFNKDFTKQLADLNNNNIETKDHNNNNNNNNDNYKRKVENPFNGNNKRVSFA